MNNNYLNYQNYFNPQNQTQQMNTVEGQNNNNFNKCNYVQNVNPANLYEAYAGFIRGNMFPDLYNQYKLSRPFEVEPMNEQAQMLTYLDAVSFAAHDLNLYLDTHPEDRAMIECFNQYRAEKEKILKQYESQYGPLCVNSDASMSYPWAWNQSPWPWEN